MSLRQEIHSGLETFKPNCRLPDKSGVILYLLWTVINGIVFEMKKNRKKEWERVKILETENERYKIKVSRCDNLVEIQVLKRIEGKKEEIYKPVFELPFLING